MLWLAAFSSSSAIDLDRSASRSCLWSARTCQSHQHTCMIFEEQVCGAPRAYTWLTMSTYDLQSTCVWSPKTHDSQRINSLGMHAHDTPRTQTLLTKNTQFTHQEHTFHSPRTHTLLTKNTFYLWGTHTTHQEHILLTKNTHFTCQDYTQLPKNTHNSPRTKDSHSLTNTG